MTFMRDIPEYRIWVTMRQRCRKQVGYVDRGIKVCERWDDFSLFYEDMGERPSPQHSIDRIDNDGDYTPKNCRWATKKEQIDNRRSSDEWDYKSKVQFRGEWRTVASWCRHLGLSPAMVRMRLSVYGWPLEKALTTPSQRP